VHQRTPHTVRATLTAGMRGVRQSFTTQNANHPGQSIDMRLVHGPFRRFAAAWRFKALSPTACKIEFALEYELAGPLSRMLGRLFDHIADTMVDAFTRRADELHGN
jgi:ribosome-associated toxin RatA of RatAB toxin-antitoxin module